MSNTNKSLGEIYDELYFNFVKEKGEPTKRDRQLMRSQAMTILMCSYPVTDTDDKMHQRRDYGTR